MFIALTPEVPALRRSAMFIGAGSIRNLAPGVGYSSAQPENESWKNSNEKWHSIRSAMLHVPTDICPDDKKTWHS
jgi:hypothetical protein